MEQDLRAELDERLAAAASGLEPDAQMVEVGRQLLLREFRKVLAHEAGSRSGADIEELHQLRVAMRKSRSVMRMLRPLVRARVIRRHARTLRSVMRASGPVRDLDVLLEHVAGHEATPPEGAGQLPAMLQRQRSSARGKLLFVLYSDAWERFLPTYTDYLTTPGAGVRKGRADRVTPQLVKHVLPPLVHLYLARVRAFGPTLEGADSRHLHDLRIHCKRLRYAVALHASLLGP